LILFGSDDTESSPDWCINFATRSENVSGFKFLVIPNAGHSYWKPRYPGYNETAAKIAETHLKTFLAKHLQAKPE
jgi:dienelactone hydrolase